MGLYALESCRIEKGFKHWGHELGPTVTPLEAGLEFTIDWRKNFTGKGALLQQASEGIGSKICLLQVEGSPLMLHDEPVFENNQVVGLTTSGTLGVRTGLTLSFANLSVALDESLEQTSKRTLQVDVAGERYAAKVLLHPPYDPTGKRMRA